MKNQELKTKDISELNKILDTEREKIRNFRFNMSGTKNKSQKDVMIAKKVVARILTELTKRKKQ